MENSTCVRPDISPLSAYINYKCRCKRCKAGLREYRFKNLDKFNAAKKRYELNHPDTYTNSQLKYKFGITLSQFNEMSKQQNDCCLICNKPETNGNRLSVDHCHKTGKIRGLLCDSCNVGLGRFKDDKTILEQAVKYLASHE